MFSALGVDIACRSSSQVKNVRGNKHFSVARAHDLWQTGRAQAAESAGQWGRECVRRNSSTGRMISRSRRCSGAGISRRLFSERWRWLTSATRAECEGTAARQKFRQRSVQAAHIDKPDESACSRSDRGRHRERRGHLRRRRTRDTATGSAGNAQRRRR